MRLFEELKNRLKKDDSSVPVKRRNYFYYARYESGKEFPIYCRRRGSMTSEEEILLDENKLAKPHDYYSLGGFSVSENEQIIAYAEDTLSRRIYTIRFLDLATGKALPDVLTGSSTSMAWGADGKSFFYVDKDDKTLRPYAVKRHTLGQSQDKDKTVHEEKDESFYVSVSRSKSRELVLINLQSTEVSEVLSVDAHKPTTTFTPILKRQPKVEYEVHHHGNTFYIRTNEDARNFKLVAAPRDAAEDRAQWKTIIPGRENAMLDDVEVFKDFLVSGERVNGQRQLYVRRWSEMTALPITFEDSVYTAYTGSNPEFDTHILRLVYRLSKLQRPSLIITCSPESEPSANKMKF